MKTDRLFQYFTISIPYCWLFIFALLPFLLVFIVSLMEYDHKLILNFHFTLTNYQQIFNPLYLKVFWQSFYLAGICTLCCVLLGYPVAYWLARLPVRNRNLMLLLIIIPFWTSSLVRSYAMMVLLKNRGIINSILMALGIIHTPLQLLFTNTAVLITLVYNLLPFMILPLYANIERLDFRLVEAARDLGANTRITFTRVILPLTLPGIVAGCILVLLPAMTIFYVTDLLGGAKSLLLGNVIENQFLISQNWPFGCAVSVMLSLLMGLLLIIYQRINREGHEFL